MSGEESALTTSRSNKWVPPVLQGWFQCEFHRLREQEMERLHRAVHRMRPREALRRLRLGHRLDVGWKTRHRQHGSRASLTGGRNLAPDDGPLSTARPLARITLLDGITRHSYVTPFRPQTRIEEHAHRSGGGTPALLVPRGCVLIRHGGNVRRLLMPLGAAHGPDFEASSWRTGRDLSFAQRPPLIGQRSRQSSLHPSRPDYLQHGRPHRQHLNGRVPITHTTILRAGKVWSFSSMVVRKASPQFPR